MNVALDLFNCCHCGELLRSRQVHSGTDCQCPYCGKVQLIPGKRKGFFGKVANVCRFCCRDLPPLVG